MYLLDTNILSELIKKRPNHHLMKRLGQVPGRHLFTSVICVMELRYGSSLRKDFEVFWQRIVSEIISRVQIVRVGYEEAVLAGDILSELKTGGNVIGIEDVLIGASALSHDFAVVTANVRHFKRIQRLQIENWLVS